MTTDPGLHESHWDDMTWVRDLAQFGRYHRCSIRLCAAELVTARRALATEEDRHPWFGAEGRPFLGTAMVEDESVPSGQVRLA